MSFAYSINDAQKAFNILINGDMAIAQRATSSVVSSTVRFVCDRWNVFRGTDAGGMTVSQFSTSGLSGTPYFMRVQRNSGDTSLQGLNAGQGVITANAQRYQGQTLTVSFWARAGANYSASGSSLSASLYVGTGSNESFRTGYTGGTTAASLNATLTTSWQRFVFTAIVPTTTNELAVTFGYTPTGTAGTNDYVDITGVMLNEGGLQSVYRGYGNSQQDDYKACLAYYQRGFTDAQGPATSATECFVYCPLPTPMWQVVNATQIPGSSFTNAIDETGTASRTPTGITTAGGNTAGMMSVAFTGMSGMTTYRPTRLVVDCVCLDAEIY